MSRTRDRCVGGNSLVEDRKEPISWVINSFADRYGKTRLLLSEEEADTREDTLHNLRRKQAVMKIDWYIVKCEYEDGFVGKQIYSQRSLINILSQIIP